MRSKQGRHNRKKTTIPQGCSGPDLGGLSEDRAKPFVENMLVTRGGGEVQ